MHPEVHLVCNAHLDPVWLWEWEEGAAEALSTFRTAADLCEEFDGFIFNHNEAILYQWIEEYEPALFRRIQRLVREGRWHIMGGWYLQPDCNLPSGESFVRQILAGRIYFEKKFGVRPTTAINFDPFGHTRGLAQILARSGYDSYVFCRPGPGDCCLPAETFTWEGFDGSSITGQRVNGFYNSHLGVARTKTEHQMEKHASESVFLVLWGVGNHGGGPSRKDLKDLSDLMAASTERKILHSTPEAYIASFHRQNCSRPLPVHREGINPWAVGCYTSMTRLKQLHRKLENEFYMTEKMAMHAQLMVNMAYPENDLNQAEEDLLFSEFHDILPGSSIQPVEDACIQRMHHGLEKLSRIRTRAFFSLCAGQPRPRPGEFAILVYNPHPYRIRQAVISCEMQLADQNREETFTDLIITQDSKRIAGQIEKEESNLNLDWRKRLVFSADLAPSSINRFDARPKVIQRCPGRKLKARRGTIAFSGKEYRVDINTRTGLIDRFVVDGRISLTRNTGRAVVIEDTEDPWGMTFKRFGRSAGFFKPLSPEASARFSGVRRPLRAVRVIEDGPVRAVVEAVFGWGDSFLCQRYILPKEGSEIGIEARVFWNEKNRALKWVFPLPRDCEWSFRGQTAYGTNELPINGDECTAQKWVAACSSKNDAVTFCNNGIYGFDFRNQAVRMTLLRSAAYACHPISDRELIPQDRFMPRIDQGERVFQLWINAGPTAERIKSVDREAQAHNEQPYALAFSPSGQGSKPGPLVTLSDAVVRLAALKKAKQSNHLIVRLFEPTGHARKTTVRIPALKVEEIVKLKGFEIKTLSVNPRTGKCRETDLMEK